MTLICKLNYLMLYFLLNLRRRTDGRHLLATTATDSTMTEVRRLQSSGDATSSNDNFGLFATTAYDEGDVILTESPLVVLSPLVASSSTHQTSASASAASSADENVRSQFDASAFAATDSECKSKKSNAVSVKDDSSPASILGDLVLSPNVLEKLISSSSPHSLEARTKKLRGMILAVATYAAYPPNNDVSAKSEGDDAGTTKEKLFELYHPSLHAENKQDEEVNALELAKLAVLSCKELSASGSALRNLLINKGDESGEDELTKLALIYSCNAFEGGRIYHRLSRANHSCNPNAVVVEGDTADVSVVKAACSIKEGDEITISYLGKFLFGGYAVRQRKLRVEKHFVCRCERCSSSGDLASRIPCPLCHPRTGRYLDEDIMFDEGDDDNDGTTLKIAYAIPENGMTAEERNLHCPTCKGIATAATDASIKKKKEGMSIRYMVAAEDKTYDRFESNHFGAKDGVELTDQDIDMPLLQMAMSTCGSKHWITHFLTLSLMEESLASFQSTLMSLGQTSEEEVDAETMEDLLVDIAECADGLEKAYEYAQSLKLNLDPAHWLFDYTVGLARTCVALGDAKSMKYGSDWVTRVESYATKFEGDNIQKVVKAVRDAWKRGNNKDAPSVEEKEDDSENIKRRKVG